MTISRREAQGRGSSCITRDCEDLEHPGEGLGRRKKEGNKTTLGRKRGKQCQDSDSG